MVISVVMINFFLIPLFAWLNLSQIKLLQQSKATIVKEKQPLLVMCGCIHWIV